MALNRVICFACNRTIFVDTSDDSKVFCSYCGTGAGADVFVRSTQHRKNSGTLQLFTTTMVLLILLYCGYNFYMQFIQGPPTQPGDSPNLAGYSPGPETSTSQDPLNTLDLNTLSPGNTLEPSSQDPERVASAEETTPEPALDPKEAPDPLLGNHKQPPENPWLVSDEDSSTQPLLPSAQLANAPLDKEPIPTPPPQSASVASEAFPSHASSRKDSTAADEKAPSTKKPIKIGFAEADPPVLNNLGDVFWNPLQAILEKLSPPADKNSENNPSSQSTLPPKTPASTLQSTQPSKTPASTLQPPSWANTPKATSAPKSPSPTPRTTPEENAPQSIDFLPTMLPLPTLAPKTP